MSLRFLSLGCVGFVVATALSIGGFAYAQSTTRTTATVAPVAVAVKATCSPTSLCLGTQSPAVKTIQEKLMKLKYFTGTANGIFDATTASAVKAFQSANGLVADGIAGPRTLATIEQRYMALVAPAVLSATSPSQIAQASSVAMGGGGPVVTPVGGTSCSANSTPSITVTAPNGGEVYVDQGSTNILVKWKSCNFVINPAASVNTAVNIKIIVLANGQQTTQYLVSTANDGQELIPTASYPFGGAWPYGLNYKIIVERNNVSAQQPYLGDVSNNWFSVNGTVPSTDAECLDVKHISSQNSPTISVLHTATPDIGRFVITNDCGDDVEIDEIEFEALSSRNVPHINGIKLKEYGTNIVLSGPENILSDSLGSNGSPALLRFEFDLEEYELEDGDSLDFVLRAGDVFNGVGSYEITGGNTSFAIGIKDIQFNLDGDTLNYGRSEWGDVIRIYPF